MLIGARCNVDLANEKGRTPIWYAAIEGNADVAKLLIEAHCNVGESQRVMSLRASFTDPKI